MIRAIARDGVVPKMPLARYFLFVGSALLALLFLANMELPKLPVTQGTYDAAADLPAIRIHSDRKWPERVVFDTSVPAIVPARGAIAHADLPAPAVVAGVSAKIRVRDAFAQLRPSDPIKPEPVVPRKRKIAKIAKKRAAPRMVLVAQQPPFGFFGRSTW
jgi:hypothetical protein